MEKLVKSKSILIGDGKVLPKGKTKSYGEVNSWAKIVNVTVKPKPLKAEIYLNKKKEYCFRVKGGNHKIIAIGESYKSRKGAMKTLTLLQGLNSWVVDDLTKKTK